MKTLIAIPVFNEQKYVTRVLTEVRKYAPHEILVVDDGSTDDTPLLLARQPVEVIRHSRNRGYGRSLRDAFRWASCYGYDWLITMDCDEQHEPAALPQFLVAAQDGVDLVSGSRYLRQDQLPSDDLPPADRRAINAQITEMVNQCLGLSITDAFCGYKAYRVSALSKLALTETGYAFPLQLWVQAAAHGFNVVEVPVKLIYNDPNRSFGGILDNPELRLRHYRHVFEAEMAKYPGKFAEALTCACNGRGGK
ncbi:MAG: glycosyltransferase family 2 protein [Phycisphaeraceae bacterium]